MSNLAAPDHMLITLSDGTQYSGYVFRANDPITVDEGPGIVDAKFEIPAGFRGPPLKMVAVLMVLDEIVRERIVL